MSIFSKAVAAGATDLHLESGGSIYMRRLGRLVFESACSSTMFAEINGTLQTAAALDDSIVNREAREVKDFSCALPEVGRLRVRRYLANGRECLAIRLLPQQIPEAEALGWPEAVLPLCQLRQGLILVTGASGSGKSTTLAAMIEQINRMRACHILTYESPVEYVFENKQALIHQCDVPGEMPSFAAGARDALRMDADVIMLGELADRETMRAAMKLAESGHLVLATMHTGAAAEAVGYFINHFAPEDQLLVQHQLAAMLRAVISQRLLPHRSEEVLVPVYELLLNNTAVANQIRNSEYAQLATNIELGRSEGMVLLEESLALQVRAGRIAPHVALAAANQPERLQKLLM